MNPFRPVVKSQTDRLTDRLTDQPAHKPPGPKGVVVKSPVCVVFGSSCPLFVVGYLDHEQMTNHYRRPYQAIVPYPRCRALCLSSSLYNVGVSPITPRFQRPNAQKPEKAKLGEKIKPGKKIKKIERLRGFLAASRAPRWHKKMTVSNRSVRCHDLKADIIATWRRKSEASGREVT